MPILDTDRFGAGPLYTFRATDPFAHLRADVAYYQTGAAGEAIRMAANAAFRLTVAGSVESLDIGVRMANGRANIVTVTNTGYLAGDNGAIVATGGAPTIVNSGIIESLSGAAILQQGTTGAAGARITNSGTIRSNEPGGVAIQLSNGADTIVNAGLIVGDVRLGNGTNVIDTHDGRVLGTIFGGSGADTFTIRGDEVIVAGAGIDTIVSYTNHIMSDDQENLLLMGEATRGIGNAANNRITAGSNFVFEAGANLLTGGDGDDVLSSGNTVVDLGGGSGDDVIYAGRGSFGRGDDGDDRLIATGVVTPVTELLGDGALYGGEGNDTFVFNDGMGDFYTAYGDPGDDVFIVRGSVGDLTIFGGTGNDLAQLSAHKEIFYGEEGIDTADYSRSNAGISTVAEFPALSGGHAEGDVLSSVEVIIGSAFADSLAWSSNAITLQGRGGDDTLLGAAFADVLSGGTGSDTLTGGAGSDIFAFDERSHGADRITDFTNGQDKISFEGSTTVGSFAALTIFQSGPDTIVRSSAGDIRLSGVTATDIEASDFIFPISAGEWSVVSPIRAEMAIAPYAGDSMLALV